MLLSSPHWSVRHAAFEGLLTRLRYNTYNGSGIVRLLPASMRASSTEAAPAVIQVVKAHLHRTPDPQVCPCLASFPPAQCLWLISHPAL